MKIANIILSVLILLCAIASAVFSYFLFEKREQFVDGWSKMAAEIHQTAVALDKNSGVKKLADELTSEKLGHKNYSPELANQLKKLSTRANQIVQSRDILASALATIGMNVKENINNMPSEQELQGLDTYDGSKDKIIGGVSNTIKKRDTQYRKVASLARTYLGADISTEGLKNGSAEPLNKVERALKDEKIRRTKYENSLKQIAGKVSKSATLNTNKNQYAQSVNAIVSNVEKMRSNFARTTQELKKTTTERNNLEKAVESKNNIINRQKQDIIARDKKINDLKKLLGLAPEDDAKKWESGSPEARKALAGKVLQVDNKFGHIVIDLGENSVVFQQIGKDKYPVDPMIVKGLKLVVIDGDITEIETKFISRVKVDVVGEKCSTALIPAGSKEIKVGHRIYWIPEN